MADSTWVNDSLTLGGEEVPVRNGYLPVLDLSFYPDNPRIYSFIQRQDDVPPQDEIHRRLSRMDHVKQLIQSIRANGGLTDPMLVRDGDLVVLEGNSRLAAYRELARLDAIRWGKAKVRLLPADISEKLVFALLGEYHIIGRKDWAPYEQAGYLYRRNIKHGVSVQEMAEEMGLSIRLVNHLVSTYQFMVDNDENDVNRWSHYDEYLKSNAVKKVRQGNPDLDKVVVRKIKDKEIETARDVRDKLVKILDVPKAGPQPIKILMSGEGTFERAFESARDRGVDNMWLNRFKRFKERLQDEDLILDMKQMDSEQRNRCLFELRKIRQAVDRIEKQSGG